MAYLTSEKNVALPFFSLLSLSRSGFGFMFAVGSAALDPRGVFPVGLGDFSLREKLLAPDWGFFDPQTPRLLSGAQKVAKMNLLRGFGVR